MDVSLAQVDIAHVDFETLMPKGEKLHECEVYMFDAGLCEASELRYIVCHSKKKREEEVLERGHSSRPNEEVVPLQIHGLVMEMWKATLNGDHVQVHVVMGQHQELYSISTYPVRNYAGNVIAGISVTRPYEVQAEPQLRRSSVVRRLPQKESSRRKRVRRS